MKRMIPKRASGVLECIKHRHSSWLREVIVPLYTTPVQPHLACVQFWMSNIRRTSNY